VSHDHAHGHATAATRYRGRVALVLVLTVVVAFAQVIGAVLSGSLALFADAGHMVLDSSGVGLVLVATTLARRPATQRRTFGWQRAEILATLLNAALLLGLALVVLAGAWRRWRTPEPVDGGLMLGFACLGLAANVTGAALLHRGSRESLTVRGAYLEVLADAAGSLAVIGAAVVVLMTGWVRVDVLASVAIAVLVLPRAWALLGDVLAVLLEATPKGVDLGEVRTHILGVPGVVDVHDLHAWTITSGVNVLSAHVVVEPARLGAGCGNEDVLDLLQSCLAGHFDVAHSTFQLEPVEHAGHEHAHHA
jgi:cobalt-zinc-cadmium efflux system protein